jgi:putative DNA primase/helicase
VATGQVSGFFVLDIDPRHGGDDSLAALEKQYGALPMTVIQQTGGGGRHILFAIPAAPVRNAVGIAPGIDVRGDGGYIVVAPSRHVSGGRYEWHPDFNFATTVVAPAPQWLLDLVAEEKRPTPSCPQPQSVIPEGQRNATLASLAGTMRRQGMTENEISEAIRVVNRERCQPPLPDNEVCAIAASIGKYAPVSGEPLTDLFNARRLVEQHGADLRFVRAGWGWYYWDVKRWAKDLTGEVVRRAKETVKSMYADAATIADDNQRRAFVQWAKSSESASRIKAMIELASTERGIALPPDSFDRDPWLFCCQNGTMDLRTGEIHPHRREDMITQLSPAVYNPAATCPTWSAFLDRVFGGNKSIIDFMRRAIGYTLTGDVREQVLVFMHGFGANGKSTFLVVILKLFGDYGKQSEPQLLMARRGEAHPTGLADLAGTRFVVSTEVESERCMAEVFVKQTTGGDKMKARFLYKDYFEFDPTHKIFLAANHKPIIRGTDYAIWRRILLVPFEITIPAEERDKTLPAKLMAEMSGILNWALQGCREWQESGLRPPQEVLAATTEYQEESDVLYEFLTEMCLHEPCAIIEARDLYTCFAAWWEVAGNKKPMSQKSFGARLKEKGLEHRRNSSGRFEWVGIRLKNPNHPNDQRGFSQTFLSNSPSIDKGPENGSDHSDHSGTCPPEAGEEPVEYPPI